MKEIKSIFSVFISINFYKVIILITLLSAVFNPFNVLGEETLVFAPFISRLKASEHNSLINISWKDSRDIKGTYLIYRHTEVINRNNFSDAYLVDEIPSGVENYSDRVINNTDFYYAVIVKNSEGNAFDIFLPYRNITLKPVSVKSREKIGESAASVRYLTAVTAKDSIILDFNADSAERNLAVLRHDEPIFSREDILSSTILDIIPSYRKSYTDYPIPGVPWYYCVIDAELLKNLNVPLVPFENTTLSAAEIELTPGQYKLSNLSVKRAEPLPGFRINNYLESGGKIKTTRDDFSIFRKKTDASTKAKIESIKLKYKIDYHVKLEPVTLDMPENSEKYEENGDELRLSVIVEKYFLKERWEDSVKNLLNLSRTARKSLKNKVSFYLGQSYYFLDKPEHSFFEFLKSSESFYPESRIWIDNILLSD
ncbi:MAG: hypothetical protein RBT69_04470 [Spirochaetia bacterium]|jgi:hypothetical protein|nr:hypothetical protein [Spirochaetia bacterium]